MVVPERGEVLGVSHGRLQTSRPGDVHVEAFACSRTNLKSKRESDRQTWESPTPWRTKKQHNAAHLSRWPAAREEIAIVVAMKRNI